MNKTIGWIFAVIAVAVIGFGSYWVYANYDTIKIALGGTNIYTSEDLDNAYNDAYTTAFADKEEYLALIEEYKETILVYKDTVSNLQNELLASENAASQKDITIETLSAQIEELEARIEYLENYIAAYEDDGLYLITFYVDDEIYYSITVESDETIILDNPTDTDDYTFNYWEIDGEEITLSSLTFSEDIDIYANLSYFFLVTFMVDDEEYASQRILNGSDLETVEVDSTFYRTFDCWVDINDNEINIETYEFNETTTLYANFEHAAATFGLAYTLNDDETGYEVSIGTATASDIIVADSYNDLPVVAVATNGFLNIETAIERVYLPDSITNIYQSAFNNCTSLTTIVIGYGLERTWIACFNNCTSLTSIIIYSYNYNQNSSWGWTNNYIESLTEIYLQEEVVEWFLSVSYFQSYYEDIVFVL